MVKILFIYIFLVFTVSCSPGKRPYFWKVEKDEKTSYFLGTVHYGVSLDELLCSDTILSKLKNSDLVLTELGRLSSDKQEQKQWSEALHYSSNGRDFKQLSPKSQKFLEQNEINKNLSFYALSHVLSYLCVKEAVGEEKVNVKMDKEVVSIATLSNIPLQALDNLELRKPLRNVVTKESIEDRIKNFHLCPDILQAFITHYKTGTSAPYEAKGFAKWIENHYSSTENSKWSLKNRNEKWFTQFKTVHKNHDHIFIAAGRNHFMGAFNLIDMLRRDGFDIERVSCESSSSL